MVNLSYSGQSQAPTDEGVYSVQANVVDPKYAGSANGTLTIIAATNALVLSWPITTNPVTVEHSTDLVNWAPITRSPGQDGSVVLPKTTGSHFFRASAPGETGPAYIPLTIQNGSTD